jgi:hypothetical protein
VGFFLGTIPLVLMSINFRFFVNYLVLFLVSVSNHFQVVSAWMLEQRFREEVTQTEKEMVTFIENVCKVRDDLEKDILEIKEKSKLTYALNCL